MLSEKDKDRILKLKSLDWTWKNISEAIGASQDACRKFFQRHTAVAQSEAVKSTDSRSIGIQN